MRRAFVVVALLAGAFPTAGCLGPGSAPPHADVVTTFYPLQYLSTRIAGAHLSVGVLVPPGAEPHEYDLKPSDLARVERAQLVVVQGAGFEAFSQRLMEVARAGGVPVQEATRGLPLQAGEDAQRPGPDPHTWLDPVLAQAEAQNIAGAIGRIDSANATAYDENLARLLAELAALDRDYAAALHWCTNRAILTTHGAFRYVAQRYNFTEFSISGIEPDAEPSADAIRRAAEIARRENITVVFFETLVSPRVAQVVAEEIGGRAAVLDPIEGITETAAKAGKDYLVLMRDNLAALRDAMRCAP